MKKAILAVLSGLLLVTITQPVHAEDQKVLAIIDSAINSKNFSSVIYEACFTEDTPLTKSVAPQLCPNGKTFMEGPGSAGNAVWPTSVSNGVYHGDAMVKAALSTNPNIKIVFVRISNLDKTGGVNQYSNRTVDLAIDWVSKNASKYSIDAVSISQSGINTLLLEKCSTDKITIQAVSSLNMSNIPTFIATGNDGNKNAVGFPACIPGVVGVGALSLQNDAGVRVGETATNRGPGLDVVANGSLNITNYKGVPITISGSSGATAVAATTYVAGGVYGSGDQYISRLQKVSVKFVDSIDKTKTPAVIVWEPVRSLPIASN